MNKIIIRILVCIALFALLFLPVYRDWAFICENTGSRNEYREWFFGLRTRQNYQASSLENFIREKYPDLLEHRWTSGRGTGKNILGIPVLYGHGRPGPISRIPPEVLNEWVQNSKPEEVLQLYNLLASDEPIEVQYQRIEEIFEEVTRK